MTSPQIVSSAILSHARLTPTGAQTHGPRYAHKKKTKIQILYNRFFIVGFFNLTYVQMHVVLLFHKQF